MKVLESIAQLGDLMHEIVLEWVEMLPYVTNGKGFLAVASIVIGIIVLLGVVYSIPLYQKKKKRRIPRTS